MQKQLSQTEMFEKYQRTANALGIRDYSSQIIHYTSQEALRSILRQKSLWFGSISHMNDTTECDHFLDEILSKSHLLLGETNVEGLDQLISLVRPAIRQNTYISSWCEYFDAQPNGKLSMWRGYAEDGKGVGLVIDSSQMQPSNLNAQKIGFHLYSTRVEYVTENRAISLANNNLRRLASLPEHSGTLVDKLPLAAFLLGKAPCVKHEGFAEEEEVRFLYTKGLNSVFGISRSDDLIRTVATSDGTKKFYEFPLRNYPEHGFDFRISTLLKKVIVGPASNKEKRAEAVSQLLNSHNLGHVPVEVCDIPLR